MPQQKKMKNDKMSSFMFHINIAPIKYLITDDKYVNVITKLCIIRETEIMYILYNDVIYNGGFTKWLQFLVD